MKQSPGSAFPVPVVLVLQAHATLGSELKSSCFHNMDFTDSAISSDPSYICNVCMYRHIIHTYFRHSILLSTPANFELVIHLSPSSVCWDYRYVAPHPALKIFWPLDPCISSILFSLAFPRMSTSPFPVTWVRHSSSMFPTYPWVPVHLAQLIWSSIPSWVLLCSSSFPVCPSRC